LRFVVFENTSKLAWFESRIRRIRTGRLNHRNAFKKHVKSHHIGIFALAFLTLLLTVPSAFAQVSEDNPAIENSASNANAAFRLMEKITDAQAELVTLKSLSKSNSLNVGEGLTEYAKVLDKAAELVAQEKFEQAVALLDGLEYVIDDIYTQLYAQVDSRQNERFETFVDDAIYSISFIVENGASLGISDAVIDELEVTLAILESGDTEAILAATSEDSDLGLTASMFPDDHPGFGNASPTAKENANGKGLGLGGADNLPPGLKKLPPGIKAKYDISTDSNLSTQSSDGTKGDKDSDFFEQLPGFGAALDNDGQGPSDNALLHGQGVGLGKIPWIFDYGFSPDDHASPPPFAKSGDADFEPGKYGKDRAAEAKKKGEQMRAEHEPGSKKPDDKGKPEDPPGKPDKPPKPPKPPKP